MFIGNVMDEAGIPHPRFESALVDAISAPLYRGRAPAGSLVFFDQRSSPYGHVGISLGDDTMLSALGGGIVRTTYETWPSYLGWRPYDTTDPDDASLALLAQDDTLPVLYEHAQEVGNDLVARLVLSPRDRWNEPPPYRSPQQTIK